MSDWREHAVCGGHRHWTEQPVDAQLRDCDRCPVALACFAAAVRDGDTHVVRGGVTLPRLPLKRTG